MIQVANTFGEQIFKPGKIAFVLLLALTLMGAAACSTDTAESEEAEYPKLGDVPKEPDGQTSLAEAREIEEGLKADRQNARYTEEELRADTSVQPASKPVVTEERVEIQEEVKRTDDGETVTESVTTVTETATEAPEKVEETATETVSEAKETVETVTETKVAEPVAESAGKTATAPVATTVVSSQGVEQIFEQKLADSSADKTSVPQNTRFAAETPEVNEPAEPTSTSTPALTTPDDGGRVIENYAASDGTEPVEIIFFREGSHRVNADDKRKLSKVARIQKQTDRKIRVVGHASSRTRDLPINEHMIVNLNVSQQRAAAVAQALIDLGVDGSDLIVESVSDAVPITTEDMPSIEAKNRRAEIFLLN
jgi:outer membrane protein OmpA-like peptidoglycan-associated protein